MEEVVQDLRENIKKDVLAAIASQPHGPEHGNKDAKPSLNVGTSSTVDHLRPPLGRARTDAAVEVSLPVEHGTDIRRERSSDMQEMLGDHESMRQGMLGHALHVGAAMLPKITTRQGVERRPKGKGILLAI